MSFTINLGSAVEGLPKLSNWDETKPPPEVAAHLRQRIGDLLDGRDHWWDFDAATDPEPLAKEVLAILGRVGLPWLEARSGLDRVLVLISGRPEELGWHDLRMLPKLLADAGRVDASDAVVAEAKRREMSLPRLPATTRCLGSG